MQELEGVIERDAPREGTRVNNGEHAENEGGIGLTFEVRGRFMISAEEADSLLTRTFILPMQWV